MKKIENFDDYNNELDNYKENLYFKWHDKDHYKILTNATDDFLRKLTAQRLRFTDRMGNSDGVEDDFIEQEYQKLKKEIEKYKQE